MQRTTLFATQIPTVTITEFALRMGVEDSNVQRSTTISTSSYSTSRTGSKVSIYLAVRLAGALHVAEPIAVPLAIPKTAFTILFPAL